MGLKSGKSIVRIEDAVNHELIAEGVLGDVVMILEGHYYFAPDSIDMNNLLVTKRIYTCPYRGNAFEIDLKTPNGIVENIAWVYPEPKPGYEHIAEYIGFYSTGHSAIKVSVENTLVE